MGDGLAVHVRRARLRERGTRSRFGASIILQIEREIEARAGATEEGLLSAVEMQTHAAACEGSDMLPFTVQRSAHGDARPDAGARGVNGEARGSEQRPWEFRNLRSRGRLQGSTTPTRREGWRLAVASTEQMRRARWRSPWRHRRQEVRGARRPARSRLGGGAAFRWATRSGC